MVNPVRDGLKISNGAEPTHPLSSSQEMLERRPCFSFLLRFFPFPNSTVAQTIEIDNPKFELTLPASIEQAKMRERPFANESAEFEKEVSIFQKAQFQNGLQMRLLLHPKSGKYDQN